MKKAPALDKLKLELSDYLRKKSFVCKYEEKLTSVSQDLSTVRRSMVSDYRRKTNMGNFFNYSRQNSPYTRKWKSRDQKPDAQIEKIHKKSFVIK